MNSTLSASRLFSLYVLRIAFQRRPILYCDWWKSQHIGLLPPPQSPASSLAPPLLGGRSDTGYRHVYSRLLSPPRWRRPDVGGFIWRRQGTADQSSAKWLSERLQRVTAGLSERRQTVTAEAAGGLSGSLGSYPMLSHSGRGVMLAITALGDTDCSNQ